MQNVVFCGDKTLIFVENMPDKKVLVMKEQFIVTHTIRQNEIPALLDSWVTSTPSFKFCVHKDNCLSL
jgi:hypothetical protein